MSFFVWTAKRSVESRKYIVFLLADTKAKDEKFRGKSYMSNHSCKNSNIFLYLHDVSYILASAIHLKKPLLTIEESFEKNEENRDLSGLSVTRISS
jgi:hypothetical protein